MGTRRSKLVLTGLASMLLMAFAVSSASAGRLSASAQTLRVSFNNLEFGVEGLATARCNVTLEGSMHSRTTTKTAERLLGYVTRADTASCNNPTTVLREALPWHVRYRSFSGVLPNITLQTVVVVGLAIVINISGVSCLARGNVSGNFRRSTATGAITGVDVPSQAVPLTGFLCPTQGFMQSSTNGVSSALTVTLI